MRRQISRLENLDIDRGSTRIQDQGGKAKVGTPPGLNEPPVHLTLEPATGQSRQLVVIRATGSQGSVGRQAIMRRRALRTWCEPHRPYPLTARCRYWFRTGT